MTITWIAINFRILIKPNIGINTYSPPFRCYFGTTETKSFIFAFQIHTINMDFIILRDCLDCMLLQSFNWSYIQSPKDNHQKKGNVMWTQLKRPKWHIIRMLTIQKWNRKDSMSWWRIVGGYCFAQILYGSEMLSIAKNSETQIFPFVIVDSQIVLSTRWIKHWTNSEILQMRLF